MSDAVVVALLSGVASGVATGLVSGVVAARVFVSRATTGSSAVRQRSSGSQSPNFAVSSADTDRTQQSIHQE